MIRRLVEAHYFAHKDKPNAAQIKFWLKELRTPQLLLEVARARVSLARRLAARRPLLCHVAVSKTAQLEVALADEETGQRTEDRAYWLPLLEELESLRHPK